MRTIPVISILGLVCGALGAAAEPLTLARVLETSRDHFPSIQATVEEKLIRTGRITTALGAFDLALEQDGLIWADGFYDGAALDNRLTKRLPSSNAKIYAGYRVSNDDFPIYEQELVTNDGGEFSLGVVFSLWRDRAIDAQRFAVSNAELSLREAEIDLVLARLTTQRNAARAYWAWLVAGQRLGVYQNLLALAEDRISGLERRAREGDVAAIYVVENRQNLLRRQALLTGAERDFSVAAINVSLYLRDTDGAPLKPLAEQLPNEFPDVEPLNSNADALIERVLGQRPELLRIDNLTTIERKRLLLAENELKPRIDLGLKAAHDVGSGSRTREGFDAIVNLEISIPLERRRGTGLASQSYARLRQLALERRLVKDRLTTDVTRLSTNINASRELVDITHEEAEQAQKMVNAERKRFAAGASDFFLVNLREERSADARVRNLESRLRYYNNLADLQAITLDYQALGI